jgi:alpha-tubulin suppressor-like RCC1 family protein
MVFTVYVFGPCYRSWVILCWSWFSQVLVAAGKYHSLLVNENGNLFVSGMWIGVLDLTPAVTSTRIAPAQFCTQPAQRIVQISGSHSHAAFITETGEVSKNFLRA